MRIDSKNNGINVHINMPKKLLDSNVKKKYKQAIIINEKVVFRLFIVSYCIKTYLF